MASDPTIFTPVAKSAIDTSSPEFQAAVANAAAAKVAADKDAADKAAADKAAQVASTPKGTYTNANRKCSTVLDKKTGQTCDLYPGDHEWKEPDAPTRNSDESTSQYNARLAKDTTYQGTRNKAQSTRGKAHRPVFYRDAQGRQVEGKCDSYTDDTAREEDV